MWVEIETSHIKPVEAVGINCAIIMSICVLGAIAYLPLIATGINLK